MPLKSLPWCGQRRAKAGRSSGPSRKNKALHTGYFFPPMVFETIIGCCRRLTRHSLYSCGMIPLPPGYEPGALFLLTDRISFAVRVFSHRRRRSRRPERRPLGLSTGNPISSAAVFSRTRSPPACDNKIPVSARLIMVKKLRTLLFRENPQLFVFIPLVR